MEKLEKLSEERLEKIRQLIENPRPESKVAAAKEFGIDLTLTFGQLKKNSAGKSRTSTKRNEEFGKIQTTN